MVIRKAVQRGMAFAQLRRDAGSGNGDSRNEQLIQEIKELGKLALSESEMEKMKKCFDNSKHIQFIFSSKVEFDKVENFCSGIENFVKSPLQIKAAITVLNKVIFIYD